MGVLASERGAAERAGRRGWLYSGQSSTQAAPLMVASWPLPEPSYAVEPLPSFILQRAMVSESAENANAGVNVLVYLTVDESLISSSWPSHHLQAHPQSES